MICKKCGAETPEGFDFCIKCGEKLKESQVVNPKESGVAKYFKRITMRRQNERLNLRTVCLRPKIIVGVLVLLLILAGAFLKQSYFISGTYTAANWCTKAFYGDLSFSKDKFVLENSTYGDKIEGLYETQIGRVLVTTKDGEKVALVHRGDILYSPGDTFEAPFDKSCTTDQYFTTKTVFDGNLKLNLYKDGHYMLSCDYVRDSLVEKYNWGSDDWMIPYYKKSKEPVSLCFEEGAYEVKSNTIVLTNKQGQKSKFVVEGKTIYAAVFEK